MTWVQIDDAMADHPKIMRLGHAAFRLQVEGLCYANRNLTDGFVPVLAAHRHGKRYALELVAAGVWDLTEGGYQIHDFDDYQPSKAEVLKRREETADRVRNWRRNKRGNAPRNTVTNSVGNTGGNAAPIPGPKPLERDSLRSSLSHGVEKARPRNEEWDALVAVFGYSPTGQESTLWGKLTKELRAFGATKPSIEEAANRYAAHMPTVSFTPSALVKHYQRLMAGPPTPPPSANGQAGKADRTLQLARQAREKELHAGQ